VTVREYRLSFAKKNAAIDQVASDDLVVVQVEGQTFELLIFVAHKAGRCRACGRDGYTASPILDSCGTLLGAPPYKRV
jgi:hypothetical protein